jgi:hypothetical protein
VIRDKEKSALFPTIVTSPAPGKNNLFFDVSFVPKADGENNVFVLLDDKILKGVLQWNGML